MLWVNGNSTRAEGQCSPHRTPCLLEALAAFVVWAIMQIWGTVMGTERKPGVYIALGLGEVWVGHWVPPNLAGFRECPASQLESRSYTMVSQVFWDQRTGGDNGPSRLQEALQCSCWWGGELASGSSGPGLSLETQCLLEPGKVGSRICAGELSFFLKNGCQSFRNVRRHILSIAC